MAWVDVKANRCTNVAKTYLISKKAGLDLVPELERPTDSAYQRFPDALAKVTGWRTRWTRFWASGLQYGSSTFVDRVSGSVARGIDEPIFSLCHGMLCRADLHGRTTKVILSSTAGR